MRGVGQLSITLGGTSEQKECYLPSIADGSSIAARAFAGDDEWTLDNLYTS